MREAEPVDAVLADQPGLLRRFQRVEHRVLVEARARGQRRRDRTAGRSPRPAAAPPRRSGSRASRRVSTSCTAVGGFASASSRPRSPRSAASRAYSTRKKGLPSVRCSSASASAPVGLDTTSRSTTSAAWSALSPVSSIRTACARASISATSASAPVGGGCDRQVLSTTRECGPVSSRSAAAAPAATRHPPSADRPRSTAAADHRGLQDGRHDPFPDSELGDLIMVRLPSAGHDQVRRAPRSRATAAARPRPGNSARPAPASPARRRCAASSPASRDLPMPGSPTRLANAR